MIIIKTIILYFIQITHTDDFPSTGTRLAISNWPMSLYPSSLCSIRSFPRGCLLFGFHFICVYVAFCLFLLFRVAFGTPYAFAHAFHPISPFR